MGGTRDDDESIGHRQGSDMQGRTKFPILSGSLGLFQRRTLQQFLILTAATFTATPPNPANPAEDLFSRVFVTKRESDQTQTINKYTVTKLEPFFSKSCFSPYIAILTRNLRKRSTTPQKFCVEPDSHSGGIRRTLLFTDFPIPRSMNTPHRMFFETCPPKLACDSNHFHTSSSRKRKWM